QETTEPAAPFFETTPAPPHVVLPVTYENLMHGEAHGLEMALDWKATDRWTLSPGYGFEQIHMHLDPTSRDTGSVLEAEGSTPVDGAQLRSHLDLMHGVAWDASTYFVDRLRSGQVPSYTRLDTGLTWRWTEELAMSLVGQNLVKDRHLEFLDDSGSIRSTLIKRRKNKLEQPTQLATRFSENRELPPRRRSPRIALAIVLVLLTLQLLAMG